MKTTTLERLKANSKNTNDIIYKSKDFIEYIKNSKTINLYKNRYNEFITQFIGKSKIDYTSIGICFTGLALYIDNPTISDKELKQELKLKTNDNMTIKVKDIIDIYNSTMIKAFTKSINGKKGGAPKGNNNAKQPKTT